LIRGLPKVAFVSAQPSIYDNRSSGITYQTTVGLLLRKHRLYPNAACAAEAAGRIETKPDSLIRFDAS
jgi:hypothetical protein